jgi:hypothetical protein
MNIEDHAKLNMTKFFFTGGSMWSSLIFPNIYYHSS